jgi:protein tyrosine/serine phosphatase
MQGWVRWSLIGLIVCFVFVVPVVYFRADYAHGKRLRVIEDGKVYRSGQMTAQGFRDAVRELGIRTVVNLQDEYPDPSVKKGYFNRASVKESELCKEMGIRYVFIAPDLLPRRQAPPGRPAAVEEMLKVYDDPANYPILIHCKAGLHRTGCMAAVYRMEYQGWSPEQAVEEMKDHGFGDSACTAANDYVYQYVLTYKRGLRKVREDRVAADDKVTR